MNTSKKACIVMSVFFVVAVFVTLVMWVVPGSGFVIMKSDGLAQDLPIDIEFVVKF